MRTVTHTVPKRQKRERERERERDKEREREKLVKLLRTHTSEAWKIAKGIQQTEEHLSKKDD